MYDYDFSNEKVINEAMTINIKYNNKYYLTNILLTSKNILFFIDENKDNFLKGSGVQVLQGQGSTYRGKYGRTRSG